MVGRQNQPIVRIATMEGWSDNRSPTDTLRVDLVRGVPGSSR
jgi:hypothetical protein